MLEDNSFKIMQPGSKSMRYSISNIDCRTESENIRNSSILIEDGRIRSFGERTNHNLKSGEKCYLYPALINVHDHLRGDYLPRVGPPEGSYYLNWSFWDNDLKSSGVYEERSNLSALECYYLGAFKNIFSGVARVNDHFPHEMNADFLPLMPLNVIEEYTLAHECSSYDLKWGEGIEIEHAKAVKNGYPFITHLEEGFDTESQQGIEILKSVNCLDNHDILIHCIGFSEEDIRTACEAGVHIGWCPVSNMFMFNVTCKIKKMIEAGLNISIGTDSTATGSINLFEEMRAAEYYFRRMYGANLPHEKIFRMVTENPAKAFFILEKTGTLREGKQADLIIIEPRKEDYYEAFLAARIEDIHLLTCDGAPLFGDVEYLPLFHDCGVDYTEVSVRGRRKLVKGDPAALLKRIREAVGFDKSFEFMPIDL